MPEWLDSPEELEVVIVAVVTALGSITALSLGAVAAAVTVWRTKIQPLLAETRAAAVATEAQSRPNSGSSLRDAIDRIESNTLQNASDIRQLRGDIRSGQTANDTIHADHAARLRVLETTRGTLP